MKKYFLSAFLVFNLAFLILACLASASTTVPGGTVSGHWTLAGSPYNIMGSVMIPTDSTLLIDPGVMVSFQTANHLKMLVQGRILAIGTVAQKIYITASDHTNGFEGIRFNKLAVSNDTSKLIYCNIQYGMDGVSPYSNGGAVSIKNWSKVVISHCTIQNCKASNGNGGAIYCNASSPIIIYNNISNNSTANSGCGISCDSSSNPVISNNSISYNSGSMGGGISCESSSNPLITYNTISNNTITNDGAGIYCFWGSITTISNNTITHNSGGSGGGDGGGIYCEHNSTTTTISSNIISNNSAGWGGGGINWYFSTAIISNNIISGNSAGGYGGGGICCNISTITISNSTITNNSAIGAISGGGIYCENGGNINSISQTIISGNTSGTDGGGIYCGYPFGWGYSTIGSIDNTLISNNSANASSGNGGGIYLDGAVGANMPTITNVTIANNNAANGGGVYCLNTCNPTFSNCILSGNTDVSGASQLFLFDDPSDPTFTYCDVQGGNAAFQLNGNFYTGTYTNDINALPKFVAPSAGSGSTYNGTYNWTLQGTSTCRDAGDPSGSYPATDLAGNTRVYGSNIDMGAYEYQMSVSTTQKPVSCYGGNNGTATATVVNGSSPFTYQWSANAANQTTQTATGLIAGNYTVTVTDFLHATAWTVVTVTQPYPLYVTTSKTDASCVNNNGTASVTASGGTAPYYYLWSTGSTDFTIAGLSAGNYTVTVTDTMGCAKTGTVSIQISIVVPPNPVPICAITVDSLSKYNVIVWDKPLTSKIKSFLIYRDTANNAYGFIGQVPYDSLSQFTDTMRTKYAANGDPNVSSWRYKLAVFDSCGNTSVMSPYHQTIFIQNNSGNFNWSQYQIEGQIVPVPALTNYLFQRDNLSSGNYTIIQTLSASSSLYTDPNYSTYQSTATWRVKTLWNISCTPTIINPKDPAVNSIALNSSRSNVYKVNNPNSVNENILNNSVSISPNPTSGILNVQCLTANGKTSSIEIYNVMGEKVYSSIMNSKSSTINLDAPNGIYFLQLKTEQGIVTKKLIINK